MNAVVDGISLTRECARCGAAFLPRTPGQLYCSKDCGRTRKDSRHDRRDARRALHSVRFIAVDGEGVTAGGDHDYCLLAAGDQYLHRGGDRLDTLSCFDFLWQQYLNQPAAAFVGYYLGYDFAQWLRDLPVGRAKSLFTADGQRRRQRRTPGLPAFPVEWGDWQFDMLGMRRFRLRCFPEPERERIAEYRREYRALYPLNISNDVVLNDDVLRMPDDVPTFAEWCGEHGIDIKAPGWLSVCDIGPYYQSSFLKAIDPANWKEPLVTSAEFAAVGRGKAGRGSDIFDHKMIRYCLLECAITERLASDLNTGLVAEGVRLNKTQWIGPGQVAQKWLRLIGAPQGETMRGVVPPEFRNAAKAAYFGGWFEIFRHGLYPGEAHGYDINSAYPAIMRQLPCLLHGDYSQGAGALHGRAREVDLAKNLVLVEAAVRGSHPIVGAMLHRRPDRSVLRPRETEGWFWLHELEAARRAGFVDVFHVKQWVRYTPCGCPPPVAPIADLYRSRLAVGKASSAGKAKKLIYNSAYGKFAQSVGQPVFGNPVYASLITAGCRTMILDAITSHPTGANSLLMVATDGVVFGERHPALDLDASRLGAWTAVVHRNLSLFMPGVYWDDDIRLSLKFSGLKSRGISARDLASRIDVIDRAWKRQRRDGWPRLVIPVEFQLVSPRQALARGKWETCGQVVTDGMRIVSADPKLKRVAFGPGRSAPYDATPEGRSTPYDGLFGEEMRETDALEFGDHPDGPIGAVLLRELLHAH